MNKGNWERNGKSCTSEFHLVMFFFFDFYCLLLSATRFSKAGIGIDIIKKYTLRGKCLSDGKHRGYKHEKCACSCGYTHCWRMPVKDESIGKWQTCRISPQIVLYLIWIRFCFQFCLVGVLGFLPFILQTETTTIVWFTHLMKNF